MACRVVVAAVTLAAQVLDLSIGHQLNDQEEWDPNGAGPDQKRRRHQIERDATLAHAEEKNSTHSAAMCIGVRASWSLALTS